MIRLSRIVTAISVLTAALFCAVPAQSQNDDAATVTKIATDTPGVGDLSHALKIRKVVGTYNLSARVTEVRLKLFFYHDGELAKSQTISHGLTSDRPTDSGRFALQIVDLDYLNIRDAKPGHHRLHYEIANANGTAASDVDVPKSTFDVSTRFGTNRFSPKRGKPNEAPLFAIIGGKARSIVHANTPEAVVESNPEADVLIAVLEFKRQGQAATAALYGKWSFDSKATLDAVQAATGEVEHALQLPNDVNITIEFASDREIRHVTTHMSRGESDQVIERTGTWKVVDESPGKTSLVVTMKDDPPETVRLEVAFLDKDTIRLIVKEDKEDKEDKEVLVFRRIPCQP